MKIMIKNAINLLALLVVLPLYILYRVLSLSNRRNSAFMGCSQLLSLFPGLLGNCLRRAFYFLAMERCPLDVQICFGVLFSHPDTEIGNNVYIGPQCNVGKCSIGDGTLLGSGVHVLSGKGQHNFSLLDVPIQQQGGTYTKVSIGKDAWLGNGSIVMANVGDKSIVGAGAVVISDLEPLSIAGLHSDRRRLFPPHPNH